MDTESVIARAKAMTRDEQKAEMQRQSLAIAAALGEALQEVMDGFEVPILNAVGHAIVGLEANFLASVEPEHRKKLQQAMERTRPPALASAVRARRKPTTITVVPRLDS